MSRDPRIPPAVIDPRTNNNTAHKLLDRKLDEQFERVCRRKRSLYVLFILGDAALVAFSYQQSHLLLVLFTAISILAIALHCYLFMCLPVSGGPKRRRIVGTARMMQYDPLRQTHERHLPPVKRFALLTHHPLMQQWHLMTIGDILLPTALAAVVSTTYFLLSLENATFLLVFLLYRLLVAFWQYRTLASFYSDAVEQSYDEVLGFKSLAKTYAVSRANEITNAALAHAAEHLAHVAQYRASSGGGALTSDADNSYALAKRTRNLPTTFSGILINDGVRTEEPAPVSDGRTAPAAAAANRNKLQRL